MRKRKQGLALVAALLALAMVTGCGDAYTESMNGSAKVSAAVEQGIAAVANEYKANSISREERDNYLLFFMDLTGINTDFRTRARALKGSGADKAAYIALVDAAISSFDSAAGKRALHVKSGKSQAVLDIAVQATHTAINAISLAISQGGN